jgi:sugar O-acyltransferase (sialic acid O-acetyltransferase NeuD family)
MNNMVYKQLKKNRKLVIVGAGEFALIAYEYFKYDSAYEVVAFSVEQKYIQTEQINSLPVVPFEDIDTHFSPKDHDVYVAITHTKLNQVRQRLYEQTKKYGYKCANYISSHAFVWPNVELGDNIFIFENNTVQPFCKIENNVVLWSGNHIGHRTVIHSHAYISSHVVISGYCSIGERCFIGVNSAFADSVTIGNDCFIAMGANITRSIKGDNLIIKGIPAKASSKLTAKKYMRADD